MTNASAFNSADNRLRGLRECGADGLPGSDRRSVSAEAERAARKRVAEILREAAEMVEQGGRKP